MVSTPARTTGRFTSARMMQLHAPCTTARSPAGALSKAIFETLLERKIVDGDKVKVIATSAPIPNYPMVMQGDLAPQLKDAIRDAFLQLKDAEILKSFRVQGFAATDDKAYDVLRETAKILDLDLSKLRG